MCGQMMRTRFASTCLSLVLLLAEAAVGSVEVRMTFPEGGQPVAGKPFPLRFQLLGAQDGTPLADLHPGAWIRPRVAGRSSCDDAVRGYLSTGPNGSRDISLNGYTFLTFNADDTLAVIDPQLNLATANLLSLTRLQSPVSDWRLDERHGRLYLSLAKKNALAVVNAFTGKTTAIIGVAPEPARMTLAVDGEALWLTSASEGLIQFIDVPGAKIAKTVKVGQGRVALAEDGGEERLFAYAEGDGGLVILDAGTPRELARFSLPPGLREFVYSPLAEMLVFLDGDAIQLFEAKENGRSMRRKLGAGATSLHLSPDGRWLLAADGPSGRVQLIDLSNTAPTHQLVFRHAFDQVVFSEHYAYLHHTDAPRVSLIHMASLQPGSEPGVIEIPLGSKPPGVQREESPLPAIAALPEGGGAVISSPADKALFLYMEDGMRAPMNAFRTWTAPPNAVLIHDRSLREIQPGMHEAVTMLPYAGAWEVVFHLPSPPLVRCLALDIGGDKAATSETPKWQYRIQLENEMPPPGQSSELHFSLVDQSGRKALPRDLRALLFRPGSNWQLRLQAVADANGLFRIPVNFPRAGTYRLGVESRQLGIRFESRTLKTLEVSP